MAPSYAQVECDFYRTSRIMFMLEVSSLLCHTKGPRMLYSVGPRSYNWEENEFYRVSQVFFFLRVVLICRAVALSSSSTLLVHFVSFVKPWQAMWQCSDDWLGASFALCVPYNCVCSWTGLDLNSSLFRCDEVVLPFDLGREIILLRRGEVLAPSKNNGKK